MLLSLDMIVESAWPACSKFLDRARTTYARLSRLESTIDREQRIMRDEIARRLARFFLFLSWTWLHRGTMEIAGLCALSNYDSNEIES